MPLALAVVIDSPTCYPYSSKCDELKVGGHQASCASMTAIMAALYFHALRPQHKVAVKLHAGPVLQAIHYLLGQQTLDQLQRLRGLGGHCILARG